MTDVAVSVALPPSIESAQHIASAEKLGYRRAYCYDSPFGGDDVWLALHRAAERTTTIELGPAVLIPTQRHPLVNAAETVSLHRVAPGRILTSFGTGFSSRAAIGQPRSHGRTWRPISVPTRRCWPARWSTGKVRP